MDGGGAVEMTLTVERRGGEIRCKEGEVVEVKVEIETGVR